MPEDLTPVPMDAADREQLMVLLRCPEDADMMWLRTLIARYDIARSMAAALEERPERVLNLCEPVGDDEFSVKV